jgi:hypothetical protein
MEQTHEDDDDNDDGFQCLLGSSGIAAGCTGWV